MSKLLFSFQGRLNRQPFWLVSVVMAIVMIVVGGITGATGHANGHANSPIAAIVLVIVWLIGLWISLAIQTKRWHDRDKSAWWLLMNLVPIVGSIWVLVEVGFLRGTEGSNRFGADPLG